MEEAEDQALLEELLRVENEGDWMEREMEMLKAELRREERLTGW